MIVSAVADPTAFGPNGITDELSKREAIAFLRGIVLNGVLLDEPTKELIRQAIDEVSQLGTKMGQQIQLLLVEIKKQHKKFVVTCDRNRWQQQATSTIPEKCSALAVHLKADVVVTQSANVTAVKAAIGTSAEVCLLTDVSQSKYEAMRNRLLQINKPNERYNMEPIMMTAKPFCRHLTMQFGGFHASTPYYIHSTGH